MPHVRQLYNFISTKRKERFSNYKFINVINWTPQKLKKSFFLLTLQRPLVQFVQKISRQLVVFVSHFMYSKFFVWKSITTAIIFNDLQLLCIYIRMPIYQRKWEGKKESINNKMSTEPVHKVVCDFIQRPNIFSCCWRL